MKTIKQHFIELGVDELIKSFKSYWKTVYKNNRKMNFEKKLRLAYQEMISLDLDESEDYSIKGGYFLDDLIPEESEWFFHLYAVNNESTEDLTYSLMGTSWEKQLNWKLDMNDLKQQEGQKVWNLKDVLGLLLFELTFFGTSRKEINENNVVGN